jgi:3-oxoacyl-[acyl-carrier protein] reductase
VSNIRYEFQGQNVIITGGTRGIGRAISEAFLDAGATVIANYLRQEEAAKSFKESIGTRGEKLILWKFNVASYEQVEDFFRQYESEHKVLHVLVNNSGIRRDSILGTMSKEDWSEVVETNLTGTFNMCRFGMRMMMTERYGRIVNLTSAMGKHGSAGQGNYAASKAGQVGFTKSIARELASRGITVNCVSPGFIDTELIDGIPEDLKKAYRNQVPMRRFGKPAEVANVVLFLASRESAYISGTTVEVTGGF